MRYSIARGSSVARADEQIMTGSVALPVMLHARWAWTTVALLTLAYFLSMLDRTILSLMVEPIQRDLGISDTQFGLLQGAAFAIFYSIAGIPLGWLVDRTSRVRVLAGGIALWSAFTMLCGLGSRFIHLFIARVGVGIGEATLNPAAYSMMADMFDRQRLARAMAIFAMGSTIGSGAAFLFGGMLISAFKGVELIDVPLFGAMRAWQLAFVLAGAPGLLLAAVFLFWREPERTSTRPDAATWTMMGSFLSRKRAAIGFFILGFCAMNIATYAIWGWAPALLMRVHGIDPATVGVVMTLAVTACGGVGLVAGGAIADRWQAVAGRGAYMKLAAIAMALSVPLAIGFTMSPNWLAASASLCGLVAMMLVPVPGAMAGLQLLTPADLRGRVSAFYMTIVNLVGVGGGPLLVGLLTDNLFGGKSGIDQSMAAVLVLFFLAGAISFSLAVTPFQAATTDPE